MSSPLLAENIALRRELAQLIQQARRNEDIMRRHQQMDLQFIGASSFQELIQAVFQSLPRVSDLDVVTLSLLDPQYDIRRILAELRIPLSDFPHLLFFENAGEWGELRYNLRSAELGLYSQQRHGAMFPEPIVLPASVAIVPLIRNRELIGTLNLGSRDRSRFSAGMASDFIEHLASIVAICIENVINNERLKHIGLTDPLTGVNNRRYVERRLLEEIGRCCRQRTALSCLYIDIDFFKKINDSIGHQAGDEVLREVANRIKAELRLSDSLGRFGGEEFIVLLVDAGLTDAVMVAERIRVGVSETPIVLESGETLNVTVSIGVDSLNTVTVEEELDSIAQSFLARADQALYKAKAEGRNRVVAAED